MRYLKAAAVGGALSVLVALVLLSTAHARADERLPRTFDISPQSLATALSEFARQGDVELLFAPEVVAKKRTVGVRGRLEPLAALAELLRNTGLSFTTTPNGAVLVGPTAVAQPLQASREGPERRDSEKKGFWSRFRLAQAQSQPSENQNPSQTGNQKDNTPSASKERARVEQIDQKGVPEVIVTAGRVLNMDIKRSRDDAQPYVIFERAAIEQSGATSVEELLKRRLTMNTASLSNSQRITTAGATSQINLRGLGRNQTLILIDGHRTTSGSSFNSIPGQGDINGIPLAAVERIEVLPTTASGIYGGGATGGVVNVILRRDYAGAETKLTYDNSFESNSAIKRIELSAGGTLEGGKTNLLMAASYSETNPLLIQDRDFTRRGRQAIMANNPSVVLGASSPPVGATTNIRSANGSPLFGPGSPNITHVPVGYAEGDGIGPLQANAGRYNLELSSTAQSQGGKAGLLQNPTIESVIASARRQFSSSFEVFLEAAATNTDTRGASPINSGTFTIPATAPNNPFGQAITVTAPSSALDSEILVHQQNRRAILGLIAKLPHEWHIETDYTWGRFKTGDTSPVRLDGGQTAALANGTLDPLRDTNLYPLVFEPFFTSPSGLVAPQRVTLKDATLRIAGPIASLPGGGLIISGLIERREESYDDTLQYSPPTTYFFYPSRSQEVNSAYLEARIPIVSGDNAMPGIRELELQLAGRRDEYRVNGATGSFTLTGVQPPPLPQASRTRNRGTSTDPTIGIRYRPHPDLLLRASYGTGFLPPAVNQLLPVTLTTAGSFADPRRGNTLTTLAVGQIIVGGNPDLKPEQSKSRSIGFVVTPEFLRGLRLSVDWVRIEKTDNIVVAIIPFILNNESLLAHRVVRGPNLPGDPPGWAGPITFLDVTSLNLSSAMVEAYDIALDYTLNTARHGALDFFATATWQQHYETQIAPSSPIVENTGIATLDSIPLELKIGAGLTWQIGSWRAGWSAQFYDSYFVADPAVPASAATFATQGARKVPSQSYHDVFLQYRFDAHHSALLRDTEIQVGVKNVFNEEPPLDVTTDRLYSPLGDARLATYYIALKRSF